MNLAAVLVIVFVVGGLLLRMTHTVPSVGSIRSGMAVTLLAMLPVAWCMAVGSLVIRLLTRQWKDLVAPSLVAMAIVFGLSFWIHTKMPFPVIGWPLALAVVISSRDLKRWASTSPKGQGR